MVSPSKSNIQPQEEVARCAVPGSARRRSDGLIVVPVKHIVDGELEFASVQRYDSTGGLRQWPSAYAKQRADRSERSQIKQLHRHGQASLTFKLRRSLVKGVWQGRRIFDVYRTVHSERVVQCRALPAVRHAL
jgi:hypothetical protein